MPLSDYERRVLDQMEQQLASDDPKLASVLGARRQRPVLRFVMVAAGVLVGLGLLVVGSATSQIWIGVLGFIAMVAVVVFASSGGKDSGGATASKKPGNGPTKGKPAQKRSSFMDRMDERWDRRRDEGSR